MRTKKLSIHGTVREGGARLQETGAAVMMRFHRSPRRSACGFYGAFKRICKA